MRQRYICTFLFRQDYSALYFNLGISWDFSFCFFHFNKQSSDWHLFVLYFIFPSDKVRPCQVICESESLCLFSQGVGIKVLHEARSGHFAMVVCIQAHQVLWNFILFCKHFSILCPNFVYQDILPCGKCCFLCV